MKITSEITSENLPGTADRLASRIPGDPGSADRESPSRPSFSSSLATQQKRLATTDDRGSESAGAEQVSLKNNQDLPVHGKISPFQKGDLPVGETKSQESADVDSPVIGSLLNGQGKNLIELDAPRRPDLIAAGLVADIQESGQLRGDSGLVMSGLINPASSDVVTMPPENLRNNNVALGVKPLAEPGMTNSTVSLAESNVTNLTASDSGPIRARGSSGVQESDGKLTIAADNPLGIRVQINPETMVGNPVNLTPTDLKSQATLVNSNLTASVDIELASPRKTIFLMNQSSGKADAELAIDNRVPSLVDQNQQISNLRAGVLQKVLGDPIDVSADKSIGESDLASHIRSLGSQTSLLASPTAATANSSSELTSAQKTILMMNTPVGESGWEIELGSRVRWLVNKDQQVAELRLNPPSLGVLEIRIVTEEDQAKVTFYAQNNNTKEMMEAQLPRLRETLASLGIVLGEIEVSDQPLNERHHGGDQFPEGKDSHQEDLISQAGDDGVITPRIRTPMGLVDAFI